MSRRATTKAKPKAPVPDDHRTEAHKLLDELLDQVGGRSAVLLAVGTGTEVETLSIPNSFAVKLGLIDVISEKVYAVLSKPQMVEVVG